MIYADDCRDKPRRLSPEQVALQILCAILTTDNKVTLGGHVGEKEIRSAFTLAKTFCYVADDLLGGSPSAWSED